MSAQSNCDTREIIRTLRVPIWQMPSIARHRRRRASEHDDAILVFPGIPDALARRRSR